MKAGYANKTIRIKCVNPSERSPSSSQHDCVKALANAAGCLCPPLQECCWSLQTPWATIFTSSRSSPTRGRPHRAPFTISTPCTAEKQRLRSDNHQCLKKILLQFSVLLFQTVQNWKGKTDIMTVLTFKINFFYFWIWLFFEKDAAVHLSLTQVDWHSSQQHFIHCSENELTAMFSFNTVEQINKSYSGLSP